MKPFSYLFTVCLLITLFACGQKKKVQVVEKKLSPKQLATYSQATFAAGCFWHEEAMFESIKGVKEAISGYAGGRSERPIYEDIETGQTGHAETINVYYDSSIIDYPTLLVLYFAGQDPTQVNGQGPDRGPQYRSIIFCRNEKQQQQATAYMQKLQQSGKYKRPLAVQITRLSKFWEAEPYHQDYIQHNPNSMYVKLVSIPEIQRLQQEYPQYVKPGHQY